MGLSYFFGKISIMKKRYPRMLSSRANNTVIALAETEASKLFYP